MPGPRDLLQIDVEEPTEEDYDKKNDEWFKANYLDLIQDHPNSWIAGCDQKVVATAGTRSGVESAAKQAVGDKRCSFYFVDIAGIMTGLS